MLGEYVLHGFAERKVGFFPATCTCLALHPLGKGLNDSFIIHNRVLVVLYNCSYVCSRK